MDKIRVLLLAMTGFGNNALKVLAGEPLIEVVAVFTPVREEKPFPYYECEKLQDFAVSLGVSLYEGLVLKEKTTVGFIKSLAPDLIVVAGFNQIISKGIISIPKYGIINIHPSLLPKYRGATPTAWALINGEKDTGVTIHFIEDESIDSGSIIAQSRMRIEPDDTDGALRLHLAVLSEKTLAEAIRLVLQNDKSKFMRQNESDATYYSKRSLKDAEIDINKPFNDIINKIRAMTPYPGAFIHYGNKKYSVEFAELLKGKNPLNYGVGKGHLIIRTLDGAAKFYTI